MRASDLIGAIVRDQTGQSIGIVCDLRLDTAGGGSAGFPVLGLVVGGPGTRSQAAHAWGFAQGRAVGPALFARLLSGAVERSRFVEADRVRDWGPDAVVIEGTFGELPPLRWEER